MTFPSPDKWEPGIYFGLPEDLYHSLPWLGSTDMKTLYSSPSDYWWWSPMNPVRVINDDDTPARMFGTAIHHCILYGRERFDKAYRYLEGEDGADASAEGLKAYIESQGARPAKLKADKIRQIRQEFGITILTERRYNEAVMAAAMIMKNPHLIPAFTGGWPEVSIFWHNEDGIPCKCRIDYLKPRACVDIKSMSGAKTGRVMPFDRMVLGDILRYRYDIQAAHYLAGRMAAMVLVAEGKVFGEVRPAEDSLLKLISFETPAWVWVFYKSDGAPISKSYQVAWGSPCHQSGRAGVAQAVTNYLNCRQKFGTDAWVNDDPPYDIEEDDLPNWL